MWYTGLLEAGREQVSHTWIDGFCDLGVLKFVKAFVFVMMLAFTAKRRKGKKLSRSCLI